MADYTPKMLENPEMLCALSLPVKDASDSVWKTLLGLMVKCSCLEVSGCCSSTIRYEVCVPLGCNCPCVFIWANRSMTSRLADQGLDTTLILSVLQMAG